MVFICLVVGLLTNALLNIPLLYLFDYLGLPAYYGSNTSTILGYSFCSLLALFHINRKYHIHYGESFKRIFNIIVVALIMVATLWGLSYLVPFTNDGRLFNVLYVSLYTLVGGLVYFIIMIKSKMVYNIFGDEVVNKVKRKIKKSR